MYVVPISTGPGVSENVCRLRFDQRTIGGLAWTPDGRGIIFGSNRTGVRNLWQVPVSGGAPERIDAAGDNASYPSISRDGHRLTYSRSWNDSNIWRVPGPASPSAAPGAAKKFIASTREDVDPRFSADGRRIVFASDRSGSMEIWVSDKNGQNITQLTSFGGPDVGSPHWSPNGHTIALTVWIRRAATLATFISSVQMAASRRVSPTERRRKCVQAGPGRANGITSDQTKPDHGRCGRLG
jgi:Tol biopolymer transport system component